MKLKLISYSGYDDMLMYVEHTNWFRRLFHMEPKVTGYYVSARRITDKDGRKVSRRMEDGLRFLWRKARAQAEEGRNKLRQRT